ncbi:carboxymuconolactone decarboxylase family protein [Chitinophaga rhizophila]|uniref:Carboxymuconolactone decarboxylase family protein n=1 Tax=Chitinophaga rhizophila TaxID=2866212 RepID=A0ABS7GLG1_9BACT|nr:carboxymuconolactone decarboxylase family protein [Chitinophaga rhizophila]MBW8688010.1 carboxymuconolactone decarboxylase family protein [Chitinophaga rhizophila]
MKTFNVPTREEVSSNNQALFDNLQKGLGKVPNLYAAMAYSENALASYLHLQGAKSSLKPKEKEVVNLVVSQLNDCDYCLAAHTFISKRAGFTDEQIIEIRKGGASFDPKLNALAILVKSAVEHNGKAAAAAVDAFFAAGYTNENLVDVVVLIGDRMITNYLYGLTQVPVDFPPAPSLS